MNLLFWQAVWFLYFQASLSAAEALLLYAIFEASTTALEVPAGYASDKLGRRITLILAAACGVTTALLQMSASTFAVFAIAQVFLGASMALASGTDSALLYESLKARGRESEIERQELRSWRFTFAALGIAALTGGVVGWIDFSYAYVATAGSFLGALIIAMQFIEPPHEATTQATGADLRALQHALARPILLWLFVLFVMAHIYGHIPFVFAQPFILDALSQIGIGEETPVVAGAVTTTMMLISLLASLVAPSLRARFGLRLVFLCAFAVQISISLAMVLSGSVLIILVLMLRMVPSSFLSPFIIARIQPELPDTIRATFVSLKNLVASMLFAGSLALASRLAGDTNQLPLEVIQVVLTAYVAAGVFVLVLLAASARRAGVDE